MESWVSAEATPTRTPSCSIGCANTRRRPPAPFATNRSGARLSCGRPDVLGGTVGPGQRAIVRPSGAAWNPHRGRHATPRWRPPVHSSRANNVGHGVARGRRRRDEVAAARHARGGGRRRPASAPRRRLVSSRCRCASRSPGCQPNRAAPTRIPRRPGRGWRRWRWQEGGRATRAPLLRNGRARRENTKNAGCYTRRRSRDRAAVIHVLSADAPSGPRTRRGRHPGQLAGRARRFRRRVRLQVHAGVPVVGGAFMVALLLGVDIRTLLGDGLMSAADQMLGPLTHAPAALAGLPRRAGRRGRRRRGADVHREGRHARHAGGGREHGRRPAPESVPLEAMRGARAYSLAVFWTATRRFQQRAARLAARAGTRLRRAGRAVPVRGG